MRSRAHCNAFPFLCITCIIFLHLVSATIVPRPGSSWSGGGSTSKSSSRGKKSWSAGPRPGFTGGQRLNNNRIRWCDSPSLPGCQSCVDDRCIACWSQYPNATGSSFVINLATGQCDCPPGYGLLPVPPPPIWSSSGRHLLSQLPAVPELPPVELTDTTASELAGMTATGLPGTTATELTGLTAELEDEETDGDEDDSTEAYSSATSQAAVPAADNEIQLVGLQNVGADDWFPDPLPAWSRNCMPCPVNYYSPGGQQGFAQCQPCPGSFTTAGAIAASNCMVPYCGPGQEPIRRLGRCRACPIGTYSGATASNEPCYPCPKNFTTAKAGSTHYTDCKVPVCLPGTELDLDLLVCIPCRTENSVSSGGAVWQGTAQPFCVDCPWGTAADATRTACIAGVCPQPDAFSITCRVDSLLNDTSYYPCGPGAKPVRITQYCEAYPPGSLLAVLESVSVLPYQTVPSVDGGVRISQEINCPAGAYAPTVKYPAIVAFNGRTDCVCQTGPASKTNCWFATSVEGGRVIGAGAAGVSIDQLGAPGWPRPAGALAGAGVSITIFDPQAISLNYLVRAMAGSNRTVSYTALRSGYCTLQPGLLLVEPQNDTSTTGTDRKWLNPLQVNCTGPANYINRIWLDVTLSIRTWNWTSDGTLPSAKRLTGLQQLTELGCINCGLEGTLPRDWGTEDSLMELRTLDFSGNNFTGTLPETWGYMANLQRLTLSSMNLTTMGLIPAAWGFMRSLRFVNLTGLYVDNSTYSCAPWEWGTVNGLVWNDTLLPPANFPGMVFCHPE